MTMITTIIIMTMTTIMITISMTTTTITARRRNAKNETSADAGAERSLGPFHLHDRLHM
jgi:Na+-driven multidrug efflux pump